MDGFFPCSHRQTKKGRLKVREPEYSLKPLPGELHPCIRKLTDPLAIELVRKMRQPRGLRIEIPVCQLSICGRVTKNHAMDGRNASNRYRVIKREYDAVLLGPSGLRRRNRDAAQRGSLATGREPPN